MKGNCKIVTPSTRQGYCQVGTEVSYTCAFWYTNEKYYVGDAIITCREDNTWYPPLGTCVECECNIHI